MQNKLQHLSRSRPAQMVGLIVFLALVVSVVIAFNQTDGRLYPEFFASESTALPHVAEPSTTHPGSQIAPTPQINPTAAPEPSPTPKPLRTLVWSEQYSQVNLRREPGGAIARQLENGSPVLLSEVQAFQGMDWARVLFFDGEEDVEGWVAASLVFSVQEDFPPAQVSGEGGANLRTYPGGEVVTWLPYGTPVQIVETTEIDGRTWAHAILPDERGGWVAQHLLGTSIP